MKKLRFTDTCYVLMCFFISRLLFLGAGYIFFYSFYPGQPPAPPDYAPTQGFLSWDPLCLLFYYDSVNYMIIATEGYREALTPFFPLYPILIKILGGSILAAVLISNLCFLGFLFVLNKMWGRGAVAAACAAPAGIYFSSAYSESLFLLLSAATLYFIKKGRWVPGAVTAGLSALSRPLGLTLVGAYFIYNLIRAQGKERGSFIIAIIIMALYPAYLWLTFGDPLAFMHQQSGYTRLITFPWWGTLSDISHIMKGDVPLHWIITSVINLVGVPIMIYGFIKDNEFRLYTGFYALMILCTPVTDFKYLPATHGLIRYGFGCVTVYPPIVRTKGLIISLTMLEILITLMVAKKWFLA